MSQIINTNHSKWERIAATIFESRRYKAAKEELATLSRNLYLVEKAGLSKLNRRLIEGGRKVWDTFAEHNFAVELISAHLDERIEYEPPRYTPPPDFVLSLDNVSYFVQIKRLATLKRENRQAKITQKIKTLAKEIKIQKYFCIELAAGFSQNDIAGFVKFIAEKAPHAVENAEYQFKGSRDVKAKVSFWQPRNSELSYLRLGFAGDMNMVDETGLAESQIIGSLKKAAEAFMWDVDASNMNIIAMEADKYDDIDMCNALFGTDYDVVPDGYWSRKYDGFYDMHEFRRKVVAVISLRSKAARGHVTAYSKILYINPDFHNSTRTLERLLLVQKVIRHDMRAPISGYFNVH